jgi:hypothetical protein
VVEGFGAEFDESDNFPVEELLSELLLVEFVWGEEGDVFVLPLSGQVGVDRILQILLRIEPVRINVEVVCELIVAADFEAGGLGNVLQEEGELDIVSTQSSPYRIVGAVAHGDVELSLLLDLEVSVSIAGYVFGEPIEQVLDSPVLQHRPAGPAIVTEHADDLF